MRVAELGERWQAVGKGVAEEEVRPEPGTGRAELPGQQWQILCLGELRDLYVWQFHLAKYGGGIGPKRIFLKRVHGPKGRHDH